MMVRIIAVTQFLLATTCLFDVYSAQTIHNQGKTGCQPHPALDLELCQPKVGDVQSGDVIEGSVCPLVREDGVIDRMVCQDGEWRMEEGHTGWGLQECRPLVLRSGHNILDCTDNTYKTETTCSIVCKPGLTLVSGVVNSFKCGIANSYTWSHQTEFNPSAILPDCSETKRPSTFQLELKFSYKNMSMSSLQQVEDILQEILVERVECIRADICSYNMSVACSNCSDENLSLSQDIKTVDVQVMLVVMMNLSSDTGPPKYLSSLSESERVVEVAAARSLFQLTNNTEALLQLNVSHVQYNVSVMSAKMSATCQNGAVLVDGFCVDCPAGTYLSGNNTCEVCSIGFYQNYTRSSLCNLCPKCTNTTGMGSYQMEQCETVDGFCNQAKYAADMDAWSLIVGVICGAGTMIIIIVVVTLILTRRKRRRKSTFNPYAISDKFFDEDPYATLPADNPYDVIPDNPTQEKDEGFESAGYICAVDKVTDSCDSQFLHSANTANYLLVNGRPEVRNVDDYLKVVDALNSRPTSNSLPDYLQIIDGANDGPLNDTLDDYLHVIDAVNDRQTDDNSNGSMVKLNSLKDLDDAVGDVYNPLYTKVKRESGTKVGGNNADVHDITPEVVFDMEERPPDLPPKRHVLPTDLTDTKGDNTETGSDTVEHQVYNTAL
ncbi:uncharacterized protein LOC131931222 [Physella acuta]|uniref:uncharacterized protein LOC131931222 n=1 Tax=Physella acuta TaxID=109671 RepID=UPI0027DB6976|nr:uncharacterized protein LOC131931222 [Physella acuta]